MEKVSETRNFVVAGHSGCGKTSLCDLMLFKSGAVERLGSVDQKTSVSDYTPEEQEKQASIYSSPLNCTWKDKNLFFVDTPGYAEFIGETIAPMSIADSLLLVVDAVDGLQVGSTRAWKIARRLNIPRFILINRIDRDRADFKTVLAQLQEAYGKTVCVPVTLPVGQEGDFSAVVNVLRDTDIPEELAADAAKYKEMLMDTIAESDEALMEKYLEGEELTDAEIATGLYTAIMSGDLVPVYAASTAKDIGVTKLMDSINNLFPGPLTKGKVILADDSELKLAATGAPVAKVFKCVVDPFIGQLTFFKVVSGELKSDSECYNVNTSTKERLGSILLLNGKNQKSTASLGPGCIGAIAKLKNTHIGNTLGAGSSTKELSPIVFPNPVMSYAISPTKNGEEDKIAQGLHKLSESDPTVILKRQDETHEMLLAGMGDQHLAQIVKKLKEQYKVNVKLETPKIAYRETITMNGEGHYKHKKQTGGAGQFAEVYLRIEPSPDGYEFQNKVVGGNIPKNFIPAIEKGIVSTLEAGPLVGCKVENIKVTVYDGKHHPVDSNEMAFKIAGRMAFRDAMAKAKPVILEPVMKVKITVPNDYMGDVTGDLNHKRGRISGMGTEEGLQVVNADVPLVEMSKYATELRSMTQGRGVFKMDFERYEQVPSNIASEIIARHQAEQDED
ncbi:MAG: elongation factor G [Victivallaceae bacterium]|nr:elongation factor G [Victivallaceae bacterium]